MSRHALHKNLKKTKHQQTVFVGLSGGVDSSVAALLLKQQGFHVVGVYMRNWTDPQELSTGSCTWISDRRDAIRVAGELQIPFREFDFEEEYRQSVVSYLFSEYQSGRTPNPDILCNKLIKFDLFLQQSLSEGADMIATGHYASVSYRQGSYHLRIPKDKRKDQTYFLYTLTQKQLALAQFPLAAYTKKEVRGIAKKYGLVTAEKKDSQGICFIGEVPLKKFLEKRLPQKPGKVVDLSGNIIGDHDGIHFYTLGQRHGFRIHNTSTHTQPHYIVKKDARNNRLIVSSGRNHPALRRKQIALRDVHWIAGQPEVLPLQCKARIRHGQISQTAMIQSSRSHLEVSFQHPQYGVASGQSIVLYRRGHVLGGGIIDDYDG